MSDQPFLAKKALLTPVFILISGALLLSPLSAQTPGKKNGQQNGAEADIQQKLVAIETGFFEAWRAKDEAYFRENMAENGIFWGEDGTLSRDQELAAQQASAKSCNVQGYGLSDFGALPLVSGSYLLTYKAEQYGTCNGEKLPIHLNGSTIYIFRAGRWQAIYRALVPVKNQS